MLLFRNKYANIALVIDMKGDKNPLLGIRIKQLRKERGYTQATFADALRNKYGLKTDRAVVGKWEIGYQTPEMYTTKCIAELLGVSIDYLTSFNETEEFSNGIMPIPKMVKRPRLGVIACGEPILTEENFDGYDNVPENIDCDFTLQCKGDSMINARINDGDIVYIKSQPTVENGQIAAVMVDNETTLKRVFLSQNKIVLQAENPKYEPWVYVNEELNYIRILGKAVGFFSYL